MRLEQTVEAHVQGAIRVMVEMGSLAPTLWANSDTHGAIAVPRSPSAARLEEQDLIWMLAWMADSIDASILGRSDEVWTKSYDEGAVPDLRPGEIGAAAADDPEVRTAIAVQAIEIRSEEMRCGLALPSVDDLGETAWHVSLPSIIGGSTPEPLRSAARLARVIEEDGASQAQRAARLRPLIHDVGWHLAILPC